MYKCIPKRMIACTMPLHSLCHLPDQIMASGPPSCYWLFGMERSCGQIAKKLKNRSNAYRNLQMEIIRFETVRKTIQFLNISNFNLVKSWKLLY